MKRLFSLILVLLLLLSFSACGENTETPPEDDPQPPTEKSDELSVESDMYAETFREGDDEIAAYAFCVPKMTCEDGSKNDICDTFNGYFANFVSKTKEEFKVGTYAIAMNEYNTLSDGEEWDDRLYFSEITYTVSESGSYVGISLDTYLSVETDKTHVGYSSAMFDKESGKFVTLSDLTDDLKTMKAALAPELLSQISEQGMSEYCCEDYEQKVSMLEGAEVCFSEEGILIVFTSGAVADFPMYLLGSIDTVEPYLNEYGNSLLQGLIK